MDIPNKKRGHCEFEMQGSAWKRDFHNNLTHSLPRDGGAGSSAEGGEHVVEGVCGSGDLPSL